MLLSLLTTVMAYDDMIQVNTTSNDLPYPGTETMKIALEDNYTIYLEQLDFDPNIDLNFPSEYYYNGTNISNFNLTYTVKDFYSPIDKFLTSSIKITSDHPGFPGEFIYGLEFNVFFEEESLVSENIIDEFNIFTGGYQYNVSETVLPTNKTFKFNISGEVGTTANITYCDEWLTCPSNITFIESYQTLSVELLIPEETPPGSYNRTFDLSFEGELKVGTIFIEVLPIDMLFERWVWQDYCFDANGNIIDECWEDYYLFQERKLIQMMKLARNGTKTQVIINETERLVMTGSIDTELKALYDGCSNDLASIRGSYDANTAQLNECLTERQTYQDECTFRINQTLEEAFAVKENSKRSVRNWIIFILAVLIAGGFVTWYFISYNKLNQTGVVK